MLSLYEPAFLCIYCSDCFDLFKLASSLKLASPQAYLSQMHYFLLASKGRSELESIENLNLKYCNYEHVILYINLREYVELYKQPSS